MYIHAYAHSSYSPYFFLSVIPFPLSSSFFDKQYVTSFYIPFCAIVNELSYPQPPLKANPCLSPHSLRRNPSYSVFSAYKLYCTYLLTPLCHLLLSIPVPASADPINAPQYQPGVILHWGDLMRGVSVNLFFLPSLPLAPVSSFLFSSVSNKQAFGYCISLRLSLSFL